MRRIWTGFLSRKGGQAITDLILGELKKVVPELTACLNGTQQAFKQASAGNWQDGFSDEGTGDWKENWFLDGEVGRVSTGTDGMSLTAGPQFKDDSHHMVLWTKDSFKGDLKIEYEYTRLDSEKRCVNCFRDRAARPAGRTTPPHRSGRARLTHPVPQGCGFVTFWSVQCVQGLRGTPAACP